MNYWVVIFIDVLEMFEWCKMYFEKYVVYLIFWIEIFLDGGFLVEVEDFDLIGGIWIVCVIDCDEIMCFIEVDLMYSFELCSYKIFVIGKRFNFFELG